MANKWGERCMGICMYRCMCVYVYKCVCVYISQLKCRRYLPEKMWVKCTGLLRMRTDDHFLCSFKLYYKHQNQIKLTWNLVLPSSEELLSTAKLLKYFLKLSSCFIAFIGGLNLCGCNKNWITSMWNLVSFWHCWMGIGALCVMWFCSSRLLQFFRCAVVS